MLSQNKFTNYIIYAIGEIVLVVIGILIALQINNANEYRKDRSAEAVYLKELLEDFQLNLQNSHEVISRIEEILPRLTTLLEQSSIIEPRISVDSLNNNFKVLHAMPAYISTDRAYNNLIGSGEFRLIMDSELKTAIADYYKSLDLIKLVQATHEMELVNSFQPYVIDFMDFQAVPVIRVPDKELPPPLEVNRILGVIKDRRFRNIITLKWTILTDLLDQNRIILSKNQKLVEILKQQTKN